MKRPLKNRNGSAATEFVLLLPFFCLMLGAFVGLAFKGFSVELMHYAGFRGSRELAVYDPAQATFQIRKAYPRFGLKLLRPEYPIWPTLTGVEKNLDDKSREDNPIVYCGEKGAYHLCSR